MKRQPGPPVRSSASAPELSTGPRSWGGGYSHFPGHAERSSYSSMPDLTGVGPMPWWGNPMMGMMGPPFGFAGRGHDTRTPRTHMPGTAGVMTPPGMGTPPGFPVPGMIPTRGPFLPPYFPGMPGMMPGMMPGTMPGMIPGMMPGTMPGMIPGMMPGMMPGMFPGVMGGMMPGMSMYAGGMPGMAPVHPQPPMMMMTPPYFGGAATPPYQTPQVTVLPQTTGSQPCVITVPIGGAGTGSQPSVIPLPIPTPVPIPVTGSGSGGGTVILTGNAQPPPAPCPPPYQYPPPQQQPQSNQLADSAALMMMMQQMKSMMSPRGGRVKNKRPHEFSPEEVSPPALSPDAVASRAKKKKEKGTADKKGQSEILSPGNEGSDEEKDVKKPADEKGEDVAAVKAPEEKDEKKEAEDEAPKAKEGTQEGETMGKGPDAGAPALSLNFPSTVALGQETATADDETEVPRGYSFLGICCYAVFVAFLVCLVTLAVAPTLLRALLDALGLVKHNEKKPGGGGMESDSMNETQRNNAFGIDEAPTQAPFFDIAETFGEIGIDDELRDGEFAAIVTKPTYLGSIIDWLLKAGLNPGAEHEDTTITTPFPLPYWKKRSLNRESHNIAKDHSASKAGRPPYGFVLPFGDNSDPYMNAAGGSGRNTETNNKSNAHNITSTAVKMTSREQTWMHTTIVEPSTTDIAVSTKSPIRELIDSLLRRRSHTTTAATTLWPLQDRLQYLPKTVYFEWFPTQTRPTVAARRRRTRRRRKGITLSFRLPEVPTRDIGKIVFYKVFRDFGYEETPHP